MYFAPLARSLRFPRVWMSHTGRKRRGERQRSATYLSGASQAAEVLEGRLLLSATTLSVDAAAPLSGTNYHTIQSAVYAAASGDTIKVAPGTYNESVTIASPLSNLTLLGGQAHLRGESGPSIVEGTTCFSISGANQSIEDFTIEPPPEGTGSWPRRPKTQFASNVVTGAGRNQSLGVRFRRAGHRQYFDGRKRCRFGWHRRQRKSR